MAPRPARNLPSSHSSSEDTAVVEQGDSALVSAKRNFSYLVNPSTAPNHPTRFRTRALLRSVHYITKFIFWRVVRYAKYVAIGSLVAAIGATAFGSVISGVAWIAAPASFSASIVAAMVWWTGKWGASRLQRRWTRSTHRAGGNGIEMESRTDSAVKREGTWRQETGPEAVPW